MKTASLLLAGSIITLEASAALARTDDVPFTIFPFLMTGGLVAALAGASLFWGRRRHDGAAHTQAASQAVLQFSRNVIKLPRRGDLGNQLTTILFDQLHVAGVALYLRTPQAGVFRLECAQGTISTPALLDTRGLLDQSNKDDAGPVIVAAPHGSAGYGTHWVAAELGWHAWIPVRADQSCLALIALGPKRSGTPIDDPALGLLTIIAAQLAIALQNAEYVYEIERQRAAIEDLQKRVDAENVFLREEARSTSQFTEIIGSSVALQRALAIVEKTAPTGASILISGETGTGKELIARAIHELSARRHGPLISVNCPAIPPELAASELFGHERGAFTGAVEARPGKFELADGGTIFLDEVADLPLDVQVKLLRVLQEHETQRLGCRTTRKLDLRVIAATNRDLLAEMSAQRFREDLYYRLARVVIPLPPLRNRLEDIPLLASVFLERAALTHQRFVKGFTPEAMAALRRYNWPGNIRELQNVVERAVLLCTTDVIHLEHLADLAVTASPRRSLATAVREEKLRRVHEALTYSSGNQAAAARVLGVSPSNFARLMKHLSVKSPPSLQ